MDLSGSNEVSASDVTDTFTRVSAKETKKTKTAPEKAAPAAPAKKSKDPAHDSKSVTPQAHDVVVDRDRDSPADRFRQGDAARPLSAARRILPGSVRPRRRRPMPTMPTTPSGSTTISRSCGSCRRRRCCRTAAPAAACRSPAISTRSPTASKASSAPGTRMSGWPRAAAASAPIGATSAASASRSASTARPAASSRSSA